MRVALLINFVAPYRVRLFEELGSRIGALRIFISTRMESDRFWLPHWGGLDVEQQRNLTMHRHQRDPDGSVRDLQIHIPLDTLPRLFRYRPDAVLSVELGARSLQAVIYRLLRPSVPLILWCKLSEHSERGFGGVRRRLRRFLARHADAVVVNGESGARYMMGLGVPNRSILRLNQPVDVARFDAAPRTRPEGEIARLAVVGTLTDRKGVLPFARIIIDWARARPDHTLELWWLGDGPLRGALAALDWPTNLTPVYCGNIVYDDMPAKYAECDALAFPTMLDEWGLVVNEAMAAGLPVLGSIYSQAVEELVEDGVTGWRFDPRQPATVDAALDHLLDLSPDALARMRSQARLRIAPLTPEATAQRLAELIGRVTGARRSLPVRPETAQLGIR